LFCFSDYRAGLHKIGTFDTVENFWKLYVFLKRPSALENNVNLYLFRDGPTIAPMWECFPNGGSWILKVKKKKDSGASVLGKMWQDMVLATIGEMFEEPDLLGISVCIRWKEDLISVWHKDNRNENIRFGIGEKMKSILDLEASTVLEYKDFASSMRDMSSFRNATAYVFAPSGDSGVTPPEPPTLEEQAAAAVAAVALAANAKAAPVST
jgi:translation initiation factor 4E